MYRKLIFMCVLLILLVPGESNTFLIRRFLKSVQGENPNATQISPSPSPVPSASVHNSGGGSGGIDRVPKEEPIGIISNETCEMSSSKWCQDLNMTACLLYAGSGSQGSFLILDNDKENLQKVNVKILPQNTTFRPMELQKHQAKKINISAYVGENQSIVLNAGSGDCVIPMEYPVPEDNSGKQIPSGATYVSPMQGAYVLGLIVFVTGGAWACLKLRKRGRHLDGVPYEELEMGQPESLSAMKVVTAEGWEHEWDDDWDEEKAVKSPGGKHLRNGQANGLASGSPNGDG